MTAQLPIPKELLQEIADTDHVQCGDAAAMARALLAAHEQEPYWWAIENRHGDARFVEEEHAKNDIWDEVHELNEKDYNGEYFDDNAPYKVVPVYRGPVMGMPQDKYSREMFEKWCTANLERNKLHPDYYAHLPAREQWSAWKAGRDAIEYTHPAPVPAVQDDFDAWFDDVMRHAMRGIQNAEQKMVYRSTQLAWNACRAAMLNGGKS